jgi:hypothetical protein
MIAQAGLLSYRMGFRTPLEESTCTQRSVLLTQILRLLNRNQGSARMRCTYRGEHERQILLSYITLSCIQTGVNILHFETRKRKRAIDIVDIQTSLVCVETDICRILLLASMALTHTPNGLPIWTAENVSQEYKDIILANKTIKPWRHCATCEASPTDTRLYQCKGCTTKDAFDPARYCVSNSVDETMTLFSDRPYFVERRLPEGRLASAQTGMWKECRYVRRAMQNSNP